MHCIFLPVLRSIYLQKESQQERPPILPWRELFEYHSSSSCENLTKLEHTQHEKYTKTCQMERKARSIQSFYYKYGLRQLLQITISELYQLF